MFGYKSFLRIGLTKDSGITELYQESYELLECSYGFNQGIDENGKAQTDVRGGTIQLTYGNLPSNEMLDWMLNSHKYQDGAIIICDNNDLPLEKIYFEQAACTGLDVEYIQQGKSYILTKMVLEVRKIRVGEIMFENRWL